MSVARILALSLAVALLAGWLVVWFMHVVALIFGKWRLHRVMEPPSPEDLQGVSIIKPLTGVDPNLKSNLETFFKLKYPAYEVLFSVQNDNDPAILVVKSLIESYPNVDAKLFIGLKYVGPNGKVNNMMKPYEAAKYDNIVVSDSGIRMKEDTLMNMVSYLKPSVGMVLQMPYACTRKGFASVYQQVYFGTMQARNHLCAHALGINCSTGMSCLMRKNVLDEAGGLAVFAKYLAEDYFFAQAMTQRGYSVDMCSEPALQNSGSYSVGEFHKRLTRWCHLRFSMLPHLMLLEPMSECMIMGVCASWAIQYIFDFSAMGFFLLHILLWFLLDYTMMTTVQNGQLPFSKFEFFVAWLLREVLVVYILIQSHKARSITWREKRYKLRWGGIAEEVAWV